MKTVSVADVAEFVLDGTHGSPARASSGVPVLSAQNVNGGQLDFNTDRYTTDDEYRKFKSRLSVQSGDVLLTIVGSIGRTAVVTETHPMVFQRSVAVIRPKQSILNSRFLFHAIQAPSFQRQLSGATNQSSQAGVYLGRLKKIELPLPSPEEQRRIAEVLDRADELRAKRREALVHLDDLTQSIFLDMFVADASAAWPAISVAEAARSDRGSIRTGPFGSQLLHGEFVDDGIAVLGIDNVVTNEFRWSERRYITEQKYRQLARYTVHPGDVLITIMGTCGRCAVVPDNVPRAINTKHLCCITLNPDRCLPEFLHSYFLRHPTARRYLHQTAKGAIMSGLNMEIIKAMPIALPPMSLQRKFSKRLEAIERLKAAHRASLAELDALFASLQDRAFRGLL